MATPAKKVEFNRDLVIERATELFWRKGYDGVSIGDLVDATGLNRYALYQAFGGKREIFIAVFEHYLDESTEAVSGFLNEPGVDPYDALFNCIHCKMLDEAMFPAGCMMATTAVDVAAKDEGIGAILQDCTMAMNALFAGAFAKAQSEGRAPKDRDPEAFAELAHALYLSTGVQARMGRSREELVSAVRKTVDSLKQ